ncbi:MAG: hypothetical protein KZQ96_17975 [Candidatus Thiodiazotropha sp. (ex Lucinoma borealis)]|nr:hypothetical protein [Candidatus Thiodiazotropha sp. (ex Lucinoma borealis)]MCU7869290.1 hypothetical protein [Candidatus Thiodiazotropha sp. (ex Lucinoma borealis)]
MSWNFTIQPHKLVPVTDEYLRDHAHYLRASMQRNEWDVQHLTAAFGDCELYWDTEAGQFLSEPAVGTTFGVDTDDLVRYRLGVEEGGIDGVTDSRWLVSCIGGVHLSGGIIGCRNKTTYLAG